jgi:uncharacterized protein
MRKLYVLVIVMVLFAKANAQEFVGSWNGTLNAMGSKLKLVFHVEKNGKIYSSIMDSPDQGSKAIPTSSTTIDKSTISIVIDAAKINYTGTIIGDSIVGEFKQGNFNAPLILYRQIGETPKLKRPQEPQPPFNYYIEEVSFKNDKDNITLSGTLSLPSKNGNFPVVVLVSGSGPQNRDEEIMGHKAFWVIADYFAKNGIGVLRYDDRGVGKSKGSFATATSNDFAMDASAAVNFLKNRTEVKSIGVAGHSEGGLIAPIVVNQNSAVKFIILLAGPGVDGGKILVEQNDLISKADGATQEIRNKNRVFNTTCYNIIRTEKTTEEIVKKLSVFYKKEINFLTGGKLPEGVTEDQFVNMQVRNVTSPWFINFVKYDPAINLKKVKCPVLAVNGSLDLQVPATQNILTIKKLISSNGNKNVTTKIYQNLNHLFQTTTTGNPNEYATIEETFNEKVMKDMVEWIKKLKM